MTVFPILAKNPSTLGLLPASQVIQTSIRGSLFGLGVGSSLNGGQTVVGPQSFPLRQEGGTVNTGTTADTIGNFGDYKLTSTSTAATYIVADPAPGARLRLAFVCNPTTSVKLTSVSSAVFFGGLASSTSLAVAVNSSLFNDNVAMELVGMSTAAWRVAGYHNGYGSTILPTFTTG